MQVSSISQEKNYVSIKTDHWIKMREIETLVSILSSILFIVDFPSVLVVSVWAQVKFRISNPDFSNKKALKLFI